jgi:hypothetical protein
MLTLSGTRPFAKFLKRVGNGTFHINSAYIGLEWIARGKGKPDDMEINWSNPKDPKSSADQSRRLLHAAMLGYVFDCIDSYLRLLANVGWLKLSDDQRNILRKSVTRPSGKEYAVWERFETLGVELGDEGRINLAMIRVLSAWRNKTSHEGLEADGEVRLDDNVKEQLLAAEVYLANRYGGLSAPEMFKQMSGDSSPRRKEIVGLVSASVNLARLVDEKLVSKAIKRESDLEAVAFAEIARALSGKDQKLQSAVRRLWGTNEAARARRFAAILQEASFKKADAIDGVGLPDDFAIAIAKKNLEVALKLLDARANNIQ